MVGLVYLIPMGIATLLSVGMFALTAMYRDEHGAYTMMALFGSIALWAGAYAIQLTRSSLDPALFWNNVRYFGISISPVVTLVFAMLYTGSQRLVTLRNLVALFVVPVLTNLVIWTNPAHRLWGVYQYVPREEALVQLVVAPGPWFAVHSLYSFAVSIAAIVLFARRWLETNRDALVTRSSLFLVATLLPMLGSAVTLAGLTPVDIAPIAFSITTVLIVVAVFEF
jgi:hypothetical protein